MNQKEFKNLFEMHFAQVRNYVFYRSVNSEVATDIAQETFLKIWEKYRHLHRYNALKADPSVTLHQIPGGLHKGDLRHLAPHW